MYWDLAEWANQSIQEYDKQTYMMGGSRSAQYIQGQWGQTYLISVCSIIA